MKRRTLLHGVLSLPLLPALPARAATPIHVYKNASCECCTGWVKHLSDAGFAVQVTTTDDTIAVRKRAGIPDAFGACHTATVEGYAIEGHVPAPEIRRLLALKPQAIGLAVPSMPVGSRAWNTASARTPTRSFSSIAEAGTRSSRAIPSDRARRTHMKSSIVLGCALVVAASAANAQMSPNMAMPKSASAPSAGAAVMTDGVVENVDRSKGVVTLKHGDITNMGMPAMTMAFNVSDKKMLYKIKTGDKVRFHVEKVSGAPTVTRIEATK